MIVDRQGYFIFEKDYVTRGSTSVGTIPKGTIVYINQIDKNGHQCICDSFFDWEYWDLPVRTTTPNDWYD